MEQFCSDPEVQRFLEREVAKFNPYDPAPKTWRDLSYEAIWRFGHEACRDVAFWLH